MKHLFLILLSAISLFNFRLFAANAFEDPVTAKMRERFIEGETPTLSDFKMHHSYRCYIHSAFSKPYPADEFSIVFSPRVEGVNVETCLYPDFNPSDLSCASTKNRDFELTSAPEGWIGIYKAATAKEFGSKFIFRKDQEGHWIMEGVVYLYGNRPTANLGPNGINRSIALPDFAASVYGACF